MKKAIKLMLVVIIIGIIIFNYLEIIDTIKFSFYICINNLFPTLIPFMLLSNILINYDFIYDLSNLFEVLMTKIFKVNKNCSYAFIMSMISGTPSNGKYLSDLLNNNLISTNDCQKCLNFCHFTNPIFVLGTIGYTFLGNKSLGLIILISHYISSILIGITSKKEYYNVIQSKANKLLAKKSTIEVITLSITSTISTLMLILGIITTCLILTTILNNVLFLNNNLKFLYGLIEITQGLKYLSLSNLNIYLKTILSSFIISFGGICIHLQVFGILDNKKIRYLPYLFSRIVHGLLSSLFTLIFIKLFY